MKTKLRVKFVQLFIPLLIVMVFGWFYGCKEDSVSNNSGTVDLSAMGSSSNYYSGDLSIFQIDQVKILMKDVKLIVDNNMATETNYITGPFVISTDLSSSVNFVISSSLPTGTYDKVKFEIHKLEPTEVPPDPEFADANGRYSVIIKGRFNGIPFVYKSTKSCHQILMFPNSLLVNVNGKTNITLKVTPFSWFVKNGVILDPMNAANSNDIDNNIKDNINENIKIFVDNDKNGVPD